MRDDLPTLRARVDRLRRLLSETHVRPQFPEEVSRVLRGSPVILSTFEKDLETSTPSERRGMDEFLSRLESLLEITTAQARGTAMALEIEAGRPPDPMLPAEARLRRRLTEYLTAKLGKTGFLDRVREWGGTEAVRGTTVHLDPVEIPRFSGWLLSDVPIGRRGESALRLFAGKNSSILPADERAVLECWLADRPSVYRVQALLPEEGYVAFDIIREDTLRILDRTSARTISTGAFFLGRPAPGGEWGAHRLMEPSTEIKPQAWPAFEEHLHELLDRHRASEHAEKDFFRSHHAGLWRMLMTAG